MFRLAKSTKVYSVYRKIHFRPNLHSVPLRLCHLLSLKKLTGARTSAGLIRPIGPVL